MCTLDPPHLESHDGKYDDGSEHGGCTVGESHDDRIPEIIPKCHKMHAVRCYHFGNPLKQTKIEWIEIHL